MATTLFCTTLAYRLRLHRSLPSLLKSRTMPPDDKRKFHLNASGSTRRPRRTKAQLEFLTQMQHHSPVTVSLIHEEETGWLLIRLIICGSLPPHVSNVNDYFKCYLNSDFKPRICKPFLAQFIVCGVIPDLTTFKMLLRFYCKQLPYRDVHDLVLRQMKPMGVMADYSFYKTLMNRVCHRFGPYLAFLLLRKLSHRIQVPLHCYDTIVGQLNKKEMADDTSMRLVLIHVLTHMQLQRVFPDEKIYHLLLKGRDYGHPFDSFKAMAMGSLMLAQGIRIGSVSPTTAV